MNLAPILISSPVRRSGTTLLQRLLCSASNSLIYGESCANDLNFAAMFISNKQLLYGAGQAERDALLQDVLAGKTEQWIPDLMPPIADYLGSYQQSALGVMTHYAQYALQAGRPVWGAKLPEWNPMNLQQVLQLLPEAKLIYLHRPLADCVRSAKSIDMVQGEQEVRQFCHTWKQYSDFVKVNFRGEQILQLSYPALIDEPTQTIKRLEDFTGAKGIAQEVLKTKVNTYATDQRLADDAPAYLTPSKLSAEEEAIVAAYNES